MAGKWFQFPSRPDAELFGKTPFMSAVAFGASLFWLMGGLLIAMGGFPEHSADGLTFELRHHARITAVSHAVWSWARVLQVAMFVGMGIVGIALVSYLFVPEQYRRDWSSKRLGRWNFVAMILSFVIAMLLPIVFS